MAEIVGPGQRSRRGGGVELTQQRSRGKLGKDTSQKTNTGCAGYEGRLTRKVEKAVQRIRSPLSTN